ncbi:hypothetical protein FHS28_002166 [Roseateles terrae]|uniref:DUF2917 domain-containing protein n=2 Tax=Roseateles terrae TaxID=431060 RepID=A0ABR6GRV6_9BURK|nr:hypothetical protein [Roseateles terrae]
MVLLPADGASRRLRWRGPLQLTAVTGPVWITREGWPQDHWLAPGERLTLLPDPGRQGLALWIGTLGVVGEPHITLKLEPIV